MCTHESFRIRPDITCESKEKKVKEPLSCLYKTMNIKSKYLFKQSLNTGSHFTQKLTNPLGSHPKGGIYIWNRTAALTDEEVPLRVQVRLVGQAAPHDVLAVVGAGFEACHSSTVRTVQHFSQGFTATWRYIDLQEKCKWKKLVLTIQAAGRNREANRNIF